MKTKMIMKTTITTITITMKIIEMKCKLKKVDSIFNIDSIFNLIVLDLIFLLDPLFLSIKINNEFEGGVFL